MALCWTMQGELRTYMYREGLYASLLPPASQAILQATTELSAPISR